MGLPHVIHFGVVRDETHPMVGGHWDANEEAEIMIAEIWAERGVKAYVSGSWSCWGPADQATDGDGISLHVLVNCDLHLKKSDYVFDILAMLRGLPATQGRWLDFALCGSFEDWSKIESVVTFHPVFSGSAVYLIDREIAR